MSLQVIINFKSQKTRDAFLTQIKDTPNIEIRDFEDVVDLKLLEKNKKTGKKLSLAQVKKDYGF